MRGNEIVFTEEDKEIIRQYYSKYTNAAQRLKKMNRFAHIGYTTIRKQAAKLGVTSIKKPFCDAEKKLVRKYGPDNSLRGMVKILAEHGYHRSPHSIAKFLETSRLTGREDELTQQDIEIALRVSVNKIRGWVRTGKLKAKQDIKGGTYRVRPADLILFIRDNPFELSCARPDMPWLISLIFEVKNKKEFM